MATVARWTRPGAAVAALLALAGLLSYGAARQPDPSAPPAVGPTDGYASSRGCRSCHAAHYRSWARSYHRGMTQRPTAGHVFGEFAGTELQTASQRFSLDRHGTRFVVAVRNLDARGPAVGPGVVEPGERDITLVTGSHHMQIYWYRSGQSGALSPLPFAYLKDAKRWVPRTAVFLQPPSSFATPEAERWNTTCIHCHTTRGEPQPRPGGGFDSRVAELGIACEACHGPGQAHASTFRSPLARYRSHLGVGPATGIVDPGQLDHERASQICSQCHAMWLFDRAGHAKWSRSGWAYRPGDDPEETMWLLAPSRAATDARVRQVVNQAKPYVAGQYWDDGQARVSGREYNGMIDSACFLRGELSCMSCHRMHQDPADPRESARWADDQLGVDMDGDRACLQCHAPIGARLTQHTKHPPGSSGSRCYNCHMPYTSYGLLKAIRAHKVTIPSAAETTETGRPNACNLCHLDRSLAWTAEALSVWYGHSPEQTFTEPERRLSLAARLALQGDAGQRALIAWALGWEPAHRASGDGWMPLLLGVLMDDPYDAVRYIAQQALRSHRGYDGLGYDFVLQPAARAPASAQVAIRFRASPERIPPAVPFEPSGMLSPAGERLMSVRDHSPVRLLE